MNEVVPDWLHREDTTRASGTAMPNTVVYTADGEVNVILTRENLTLKDEIERLKAENAELREKCMTRFARIKNAANADEMAQMLHKVYMTGMGDAVMTSYPRTWDGIADISQWLQEIGTI